MQEIEIWWRLFEISPRYDSQSSLHISFDLNTFEAIYVVISILASNRYEKCCKKYSGIPCYHKPIMYLVNLLRVNLLKSKLLLKAIRSQMMAHGLLENQKLLKLEIIVKTGLFSPTSKMELLKMNTILFYYSQWHQVNNFITFWQCISPFFKNR